VSIFFRPSVSFTDDFGSLLNVGAPMYIVRFFPLRRQLGALHWLRTPAVFAFLMWILCRHVDRRMAEQFSSFNARISAIEPKMAAVLEESAFFMTWAYPKATAKRIHLAAQESQRFAPTNATPWPPLASLPSDATVPQNFPPRDTVDSSADNLLSRVGPMPDPDDVLEGCRRLRQTSVLLGALERPPSANGELLFSRGATGVEPLHVWYRMSPRSHKRGSDSVNLPVPVVSFLSLVGSLRALSSAQRRATALHVLFNGFVDRAAWVVWLRETVGEIIRSVDIDENCPVGNARSYSYMMDRIYAHRDPKAVMFLVEDDYVCHPEMLAEVVQLFASHDVCMAVPYDYMDRYTRSDNIDDGHIKVIAGGRRHWRTVESSTVTFASRLQLMNAVKDILPAPWSDRWRCRELRRRGVEIWGPMPSLASHFNWGIVLAKQQSPYIDYFKFISTLLRRSLAHPPPYPDWNVIVRANANTG